MGLAHHHFIFLVEAVINKIGLHRKVSFLRVQKTVRDTKGSPL